MRPREERLVMQTCLQSHLRSENLPAEGPEPLGSKMAGEIWHRLAVFQGKPTLIPAIRQQAVNPGLQHSNNMSGLL